MVLANGTVIVIDADRSSPQLFSAARASMGRLGVVVDLTFRIVPNRPVRKTSATINPSEFVDMVAAASDAGNGGLKRLVTVLTRIPFHPYCSNFLSQTELLYPLLRLELPARQYSSEAAM
jgi:hypothetical protein